jgi:hypothetical protein
MSPLPSRQDGDVDAVLAVDLARQRPRSIPIIVAGAKNAAISMVVRIFGDWSGTSVPVGEKK